MTDRFELKEDETLPLKLRALMERRWEVPIINNYMVRKTLPQDG